MPVGTLPVEQVEERLMDARRTYRLNLGCVPSALPRAIASPATAKAARKASRVPALLNAPSKVCSCVFLAPTSVLQVCWADAASSWLREHGEEIQSKHHGAGAVKVRTRPHSHHVTHSPFCPRPPQPRTISGALSGHERPSMYQGNHGRTGPTRRHGSKGCQPRRTQLLIISCGNRQECQTQWQQIHGQRW